MGSSLNALINLEMLKALKKGKLESEGGWKGPERLQSQSSQNEKTATTSRQKVHQGGGGCTGCEWTDPLHLSRVQQKAQLGETENPHAYPLRIERTSPDIDARKDGESSIADGAALESSSSSFAGSRFLAGSQSDARTCGPPRTSQVRGGAATTRKHSILFESHDGTGKAKSSNCTRGDRRCQGQGKRWQEQEGRRQRAVASQRVVQNDVHFEEGAIFDIISRQHGSFSRFMKLFSRPVERAGASTIIHNEIASTTLFPSKIPWCKPPSKSRVRRGSRSQKRVAFEWLRALWRLCNFLEGGSPCSTVYSWGTTCC